MCTLFMFSNPIFYQTKKMDECWKRKDVGCMKDPITNTMMGVRRDVFHLSPKSATVNHLFVTEQKGCHLDLCLD